MRKQETAVTVRVPEISLVDMEKLAANFAKSLFFQDAKEAAQALVKIQAGKELGLPPVYAMTKIFFVQGRITLSAEAMGALIKRTRGEYDYFVTLLDNSKCVIEFTHNGKLEYTSTFTIDDAIKAELIKAHGNWDKWPRPMLMSKALSQGARIVCPHIISGAYTPEDFGIETDDEGNITQPQRISQVAIEGEVIQPTVSSEELHEAMSKGEPVKVPTPKPTPEVSHAEELGKLESAMPKDNPIKIDMDWLQQALTRLKYQTSIYSYIPSVPELKNIDTKSKDLNKVLAQMTPEQQEILVKKLIERAELSGVKLD